mgnify:CR=1 FL=1
MTTPDTSPDAKSETQANTDPGAGNSGGTAADIVALKRSHDVEIRERDTRIATLSDEVASMRTASEAGVAKTQQAETALQEATAQLETLKAEAETSSKRVEELTATALQSRRDLLVQKHSLKPDTLKDMNESQLSALETVLPSTQKVTLDPGNLDISGSGGSGANGDLSARETIRAGLTS